jgi:predicted phage terminase large subunit-like protein
MRTNQLILNAAREIYLKHHGRNHREIEREMHALGCRRFSRRVLYNQKTKTGQRPGWPTRFGWRDELTSIQGADLPPTTPTPADSLHATSFPSPSFLPDSSPRLGASAVGPSQPTANCQPPTDFKSWLNIISPNMTWDWRYQQLIYDKLDAITTGKIKRLMIFLPPRHGKSELVTNRFTAWRLLCDPKLNVILGSYNQRLANRFSRKVRITWEDGLGAQAPLPAMPQSGMTNAKPNANPTSQANPTSIVSPSPSLPISLSPVSSTSRARLNTVAEWETGLGGGVRAVGVGGGITGFGADLVIIDDPIKSRAEAESKTYRERVWDWFNDDLYTRLEPGASIILIQTRWHEDDLAGRLLKETSDGGEHWEVISLPALAEEVPLAMPSHTAERLASPSADSKNHNEALPPSAHPESIRDHSCSFVAKDLSILHSQFSILNSSDPLNRKPGEALCPERFSKEDLHRIKRRLGSYSFSALYQQRPTPPDGGLFKRSWFTRIVDRPPADLRWARGYDLAVSTRNNADYTASFRSALDKQTGDLYIADGMRKRMEFPEQRRFIVDKIRTETNTEHGIEQALHGQAFIQELRREHRLFGRAFRGVTVTADKFTRALAWANLAEDGKVVLVRGPWIDAFLEEICSFPNSQHDDQLDAVSLSVEMLSRQTHRVHGF